MRRRNILGPINFLLVTSAAGLLSGCAGSFAPMPVQPEQVPIGNIQGRVHGGNLPVTGASIYLYQASTTGYGSKATSLICNPTIDTNACPTAGTYGPFKDTTGNYYVQTDANGNFALSGDYMCTQNAQVYMVAIGGNPGVGTSTTTATFSSGSTTMTVASATGITVGELATGTGVNGTVTAVTGTTVTLNRATTSSGAGASVTFGPSNPAIVQMTGLGQCPAAGNLAAQVPWLVINEVTTVAFAYAMGGFATTTPYPYLYISADAGGATGLANAMANFQNIVNVGNGLTYMTAAGNSNSVAPYQRINTLANILATCVNQTSSTATPCTSLFKYATPTSGTPIATDEATAIFNIVHNQSLMNTATQSTQTQAQNITSLYNLMNGTAPFGPYLTSAPSDWTLPVVYSGVVSPYGYSSGQLNSGPTNIAFDASGNAWIGDRAKGVVEMTPTGAVTTYNPGFKMVKGIAVYPDSTKIWVTDYKGGTGTGQLDLMSTTGTISASTTTDMNGPSAVAVDSKGNAFVVNDIDGSVAGVSSTGSILGYASAVGVTSPEWIAFDNNNNILVPSASTSKVVVEIPLVYAGNSGNVKNFGTPVSIAADYAYGLALDSTGNIWFATNETSNGAPNNESLDHLVSTTIGSGKNATTSYSLNTPTITGDGWNGGGLGIPLNISVDGANNIWIPNSYYKTVSGYSQTLSSWMGLAGTQQVQTCVLLVCVITTPEADATGFSNASTGNTVSAAPDLSGNLWTANMDGTVTQLLGIAAPTATPIYPGVFGTEP